MVTTVPSTLKAFLLPLAMHFRAKGWHVEAAASGLEEHSDLRSCFDELHSVSFARSFRHPLALLQSVREMERLCRRKKYSVVHVHTPIAAFLTRFALRRLRAEIGVKVIYTAHGFHFFKGANALAWLLYGFAERLAGQWTDRLVVINAEDYDRSIRWRIVSKDRIIPMPGIGVDPGVYSKFLRSGPRSSALRHELGAMGQFLILMIAEFSGRKRQSDLVKALALIKDPSISVLFVGDGRERVATERLVADLGVGAQFRFLGYRSDVPELLGASDLLVLPSLQEGLPRCVLEAMAANVPVVGSDIRGTRDLLSDGRGWLYKVGDVSALANAISDVRSNPKGAAQRIANADRAVCEQYALKQVIAAHDFLYEGALANAEARASAQT